MWAPSLSSLTEVKEETRRDEEGSEPLQIGAMTRIARASLHAFIRELNGDIAARLFVSACRWWDTTTVTEVFNSCRKTCSNSVQSKPGA